MWRYRLDVVSRNERRDDNFIPGTPCACPTYIYIYICADGARGRTLAHVQATWARPTMRARTELFIPAGDSVSLVSFSFSATLWTSENSPHPRPLPPPLGFSLSFSSYFFPSFSLSFLLAYNLAKRKSGPLAREIFSKTFLIFPASHSPGISPRRNFYSSSSPFFFRFLSFSRRNSPRRGRNAFLARFRARITDFGKLRISNFFRGYNILGRRKKGKNPAFWITIFDWKNPYPLFNCATKRKRRRLIN